MVLQPFSYSSGQYSQLALTLIKFNQSRFDNIPEGVALGLHKIRLGSDLHLHDFKSALLQARHFRSAMTSKVFFTSPMWLACAVSNLDLSAAIKSPSRPRLDSLLFISLSRLSS
jgi:hypothetical protein